MLNFVRALKADVNIVQALSMSLRRTLTRDIIKAMSKAKENQITITPVQMEAHFIAGGNALELVEACIALKVRNIDYSMHDLMVLDLSRQSLPLFIQAFVKSHSYYTDLSLDEFLQRHYLGEDVVENAMKYRFEPWKHMKSLRARITYTGLGFEDIKRIKQSHPNELIEVFDPSSEKWLKADEMKSLP